MKFSKYLLIFILIFTFFPGNSSDKTGKNQDSIHFSYLKRFQITPIEKSQNVKIIALLPQDYKNRQKITEMTFSVKPARIFDDGNNLYAEFILDDIDSRTDIYIKCFIDIFKYDLKTVKRNRIKYKFESKKTLSIYLKDEQFIESNDPSVIETARQFNAKSKMDIVKQIYDFIILNTSFERQKEEKGALFALNSKKGGCIERSALFIALCRASGLPARQIYGYTPLEGSMVHAWAEVYFKNLGWVPFDPTPDCLSEDKSVFDNLANNYTYLSFKKNDKIINGNRFEYIEISDSSKVRVRTDTGIYLLIFKHDQ